MVADTQQRLGRHRKRKTHEHQWWILGSLKPKERQETSGSARKTKKDKATECYVTCININNFSNNILVRFEEFGVGQVGRVGQVICVRLFDLVSPQFRSLKCALFSHTKSSRLNRKKGGSNAWVVVTHPE